MKCYCSAFTHSQKSYIGKLSAAKWRKPRQVSDLVLLLFDVYLIYRLQTVRADLLSEYPGFEHTAAATAAGRK